MRRVTFFGVLYCTFCILLGVLLFIAIRTTFWPHTNKQKQQASGVEIILDPGTARAFEPVDPGTMRSFDPRVPVAKPVIRIEPGKAPVIIYPESRESTAIVKTTNGTGVFVDEGVEWQGKIAYLALTSYSSGCGCQNQKNGVVNWH